MKGSGDKSCQLPIVAQGHVTPCPAMIIAAMSRSASLFCSFIVSHSFCSDSFVCPLYLSPDI